MPYQIANVEYDFVIEKRGVTRPLIKQVHHNVISEVNKDTLAQHYQNPPEADGVITTSPELKLSVFTADCIPILLFQENQNGSVAALHCGWRGAQSNIVGELLKNHAFTAENTHAILGPCILSCCFEVKADLIESFSQGGYDISRYLKHRGSKIFFSLTDFVLAEQLAFISRQNLHLEHMNCTFCSIPQLPSYRRDKITDPRIRSSIRFFV